MLWLAIILGLVSLASLIYISDGYFGKLDFSTSSAAKNHIIRIIKDTNLRAGKFYDLGSSRGGLAKKVAKAFPKLTVYGIDDSKFRTALAKTRGLFYKNLNFRTENIFTSDVSEADIIYIYLPQELMPNLEIKLQKELKPGSLVISTSVSFPNWQPQQIKILKKSKIFSYVKI